MGNNFFNVIQSAVLTLKGLGYKDTTGVPTGTEQQGEGKHRLAFTSRINHQMRRIRWLPLSIFIIGLVVISFGMVYWLQSTEVFAQLQPQKLAWLAYLTIFGITLVCNLTVIAPVPIATAMMIAAATRWDPALVAMFASIGGTLGELSGYYVGYFGKKIAIIERKEGQDRIAGWMNKHGGWAVFFLALQPVLPFDIAGLVAGASRMPVWKFLAALWLGKFIKYIVICYSGVSLIHFLPWSLKS